MLFPGPIGAHRTAFPLGGLKLIVHFAPPTLTLPACLIRLTHTVVLVGTEPGNLAEDLHSLDGLWAGLAILWTEMRNRLRTEPGNRAVIRQRRIFLSHVRERGPRCRGLGCQL
jgi:hypothetical protein